MSMGPSNGKHCRKSKKSTGTPPCIDTSLSTENTTKISPPDDTSSATRVAFWEFIELADLNSIKVFITTAASSPEGENLKLLWGRAFKEGLIAGHQLYGKTEERLKVVHAEAYEEGFQVGYNEGRRNEHGDWALDGHGMHCSYQAIPLDDYGTQPVTQPDLTTTTSISVQTHPTTTLQTSYSTSSTQTSTLYTNSHPMMEVSVQTNPSTLVATSQLPELPGNQKNTKFHSTSAISPNLAVFSPQTSSVVVLDPAEHSTTATALEMRPTTAGFTTKRGKVENSSFSFKLRKPLLPAL
jgi:hypothetical protein